MAPKSTMKEAKWREFHNGLGSVIQRSQSKSGKVFLSFLTPSGERFDSWKKAEAYMNAKRIQNITDGSEHAPNLTRGRIMSLSHMEKREFREWYWRKKGGQVIRKEYVDKETSRTRWEVKYITPGGRESFRSWKQCVKYLGNDPHPSMTKWTSRKNQLVTPNQIISIISRGRRRRGNVTSPSSSRTIVSAPKPQIGTRTITGAILNNAAQSVEAEGGNSHIFEGGDSVDSSNEGKRTWNQHGGEISPVECDTSRCSDMKAQEDNRKVKAEATSSSREQAKMAARRKMLESGTNWKRRRFLKLDNASDATHEAKDTTAGEASKDDIPTEQEIEQRSIRMLEPPSPRTSRTRRSSLKRKAKERVFLTVETEDHDEVEKQKKVTFYGENNEEAKERKESKGSSSALSANDASLQQNLINLLYADHLRQASNDTKTGLITKMYEEYVQRSFSRCQNTNVGVLSLALAKRKQTARSIASIISDKKERRAGNKLKTQTSRI